MKKKSPKLPIVGNIPNPMPMTPETLGFFRDVLNARKEYAIVKEQESTKRDAIMARLKGRLEDISARRELVASALEKDFSIRQNTINEFFIRLDQALEDGKDDVAIQAAKSIEGIVKTSHMGSALRALADNFEHDDGVIDI